MSDNRCKVCPRKYYNPETGNYDSCRDSCRCQCHGDKVNINDIVKDNSDKDEDKSDNSDDGDKDNKSDNDDNSDNDTSDNDTSDSYTTFHNDNTVCVCCSNRLYDEARSNLLKYHPDLQTCDDWLWSKFKDDDETYVSQVIYYCLVLRLADRQFSWKDYDESLDKIPVKVYYYELQKFWTEFGGDYSHLKKSMCWGGSEPHNMNVKDMHMCPFCGRLARTGAYTKLDACCDRSSSKRRTKRWVLVEPGYSGTLRCHPFFQCCRQDWDSAIAAYNKDVYSKEFLV
ncbi:hypothetical protein HK104_007985 [Borealophlyctis nickersoniae]|nr:hypothetical protein HK104_007985 [Borealophlyctis nickersoniae]